MKKILRSLTAIFVFCMVLGLCSCGGCNKKQNGDSRGDKTAFDEKNVTVNYRDVVYLPDYFTEKDDFSTAELFSPSGSRISMRDGNLYADTMGEYELVLHESRQIYHLDVADIEGPIVMLKDQNTTVYWGNEVAINPIIVDNVDKIFDVDSVHYTVKKRGEEVRVSDSIFLAEELGEYSLEFDVQDTAGNQAKPVTVNCEMPKVIVKPVGTKITLSDDIFKGLIDDGNSYSYETTITRVTEDGRSAVKDNTITIEKDSIYKIKQTATCGEEVIALNYIYRSENFMLYDFDDQDISMITTATQSGLTSSTSVKETAAEDYAVLVNTSGLGGWTTFYISGLESNTTYDRISFDVTLTKTPTKDKDSLKLSFYNKQGEGGHTIVKETGKTQTATFSNITTDNLGIAKVYAYVHESGVTEFTIDNMIVQRSTAVNLAKGLYIAFSGGAKNVEKANTNTGYNILHLDIQRAGWSSLKIFATKEAGLKANTEYRVSVDVACDGTYPSFYEEHDNPSRGNDFVLGAPGGKITFLITTDRNGEFEKLWTTILLNTGQGLTFAEFTGAEITENRGSLYGKGITVQPTLMYQQAEYTISEKLIRDGENAGKTYSSIENVTKAGKTMLTVSASRAAGLKADTSYKVAVDVACDGVYPSFYEEHPGGNDFVFGAPGGKIEFYVTTDANGEFTKTWETLWLNGATYVDFTGIAITEHQGSTIPENKDTVYGEGITVQPALVYQQAEFTISPKTITEGEQAGKIYYCMEDITKSGRAMLTIAAASEAGLKANTEYTVAAKVSCDGSYPSFYEEHTGGNDFVFGAPGGVITFNITTDENGTFEKVWDTLYLNAEQGLTNVEFTDIEIRENKGSVYGKGITVQPTLMFQQAEYSISEKKVADGEEAGKTYTAIEAITKSGKMLLTVAAGSEAGLKANTEYNVVMDVACDGSFPSFFEEHTGGNDFVFGAPGGQIAFTVTTDEKGEFQKVWDTLWLLKEQGLSYVEFTGLTITETRKTVSGVRGIVCTSAMSGRCVGRILDCSLLPRLK